MGLKYIQDGPVSASFLYRAYLATQTLGARKPVLLDALQLEEADLRNPLNRFHQHSVTALYRAASGDLQDRNISSEMGYTMLPAGFSDAGFSALFQPNFGEALLATLNAYRFGSDRPLFHLECSDQADMLILDIGHVSSQELVQIMAANIVHFGQLLAGDRQPTVKAIHFAHSRPSGFEEFDDIWGEKGKVRCFFNQKTTCLEYYPRFFNRANPRYSRSILTARQRQIGQLQAHHPINQSLANMNYVYLVYLLDKSGLSLDAAAEAFGVAERTMRRKLVAEGSSFRYILEQVRRDTCQLYFLEGTRRLSDISAKLGYSELSAFTRAYTAWHGNPPSRDMAGGIMLAA